MANILFKRGLQSALPKIAQDGVFYLTTDTNRLYVGQSDNSTPVLLNQTVQIVPSVSYLPGEDNNQTGVKTVNDFYYCTAENILAVYTGTEWKQINPDHNDNDTIKVTGITVSNPVADATNSTLTYDMAVQQSKTDISGKVTNLPNVNFAFTLTNEDLEKIIHDPASVSLSVSAVSGAVKVATAGTGSDGDADPVIIKGGSNVTVSSSSNEITISAIDSQYKLSTAASGTNAQIKLTNTGDSGEVTSATFKAGTDLNVQADTNGITYNHASVSTTQDKATQATSLNAESTINVVTAVDTNNGHTTKVTTKSYKLPVDTKITAVTDTIKDDWKTTITQTGGQLFNIDFSSDAAALEEKLFDEIDSKLAAANTALTYKGTVEAYSVLTGKTSVEIGDVWMLNADDGSYKTGDLFIATVANEADHNGGVITEGKVVWTYVPSGDELNTDTLFYGDVTVTTTTEDTGGQVKYTLKASATEDGENRLPADNEELVITGGEDILIKSSGTNNGAEICHKDYGIVKEDATGAVESSTELIAVTGLEINNGHITKIIKEKFTPETVTLSGKDNKIVLKNNDGDEKSSIAVSGDDWIIPSITDGELAVVHGAAVVTGATSEGTGNTDTTLEASGSFNVLTNVKYDINGHIVSVTEQTLTLPEDNNTHYDLFIGESSSSTTTTTKDVQNPYLILKDEDGARDTISLISSNESLTVTGSSGAVTFGLVWDTF